MSANRGLREELIATAHAVHTRGWVANHDGNLTVRLGPNRFLATPTATSKARVDHRNLIEVDAAGKRVSGTAGSFSEVALHLTVYREREDVGAVVHAHPPYATALACSGDNLIERPFMPEVIVSLGPWIPLVELTPPGAAACDALARYVADVDVVLMASHGVLVWGRDLETAFLRLELVEHHARIALAAQAVGGVRQLPESMLEPLLASRAKAGLGAAGDRAVEIGRRVSSMAIGATTSGQQSTARTRPDLTTLVREELLRALDKS